MRYMTLLLMIAGLAGCGALDTVSEKAEDAGEAAAPVLVKRFCSPTGPTERAMGDLLSAEAKAKRAEFCAEVE